MKFTRMMMMSFAAFAIIVLSAGCGGGTDAGGSNGNAVVVNLKSTTFDKRKLEVKTGTTVRWLNQDQVDHSVWEGDPDGSSHLFQTPDLKNGEDFKYTFDKPGTYKVYCNTAAHHLIGMTMEVVVK